MRWLSLMALGSCYVTYFMYMDWDGFFIPFTNWALVSGSVGENVFGLVPVVMLFANIQATALA